MAKSTTGKPVRIGRIGDLKVVANQSPKPAANAQYFAIRVQGARGSEATLLLTRHEVERALTRAKNNPEDVPTAANLFDRLRDACD